MNPKILPYLAPIFIGILFSSCASYKQNIMFKTDGLSSTAFNSELNSLEENYKIKPNDRLEVNVYTKGGEILIDPEFQLRAEMSNQNYRAEKLQYLVNQDGLLNLPMVGLVEITEMTLTEAEEYLSKKYALFYEHVFVQIRFVNKRAYVLVGNGGQVVPLQNENTTLIELLAMAGGLPSNAKAQNIRLIRGNQVQIVDLSTVEGYNKINTNIQPGDIVYIEPIRRPFVESVRDYSPVLGFVSGLISVTAVILSLR
ncbi:MAG: polysaccharide biosynthesis/export family protein [Cyclobacteriaceae bacterium]|nr:polysaccharide biosynthesis/export family protein [Cyclobacteriaceae bacterium]